MRVVYAEWASMAGNALYVMVILAVAQYHSRHGTFWVGIMSAIMLVPPLFSGLFGVIIDAGIRHRRQLLMLADATRVLLVIVAILAIELDQFTVLVIVSGLVSGINVFFGQTFRTWIPSVVQGKELRKTTGLYQTGNTVAQVFAVSMGFLAFHWSVTVPPLVFDVCTFILSLIMLSLYYESPAGAPRARESKTQDKKVVWDRLFIEVFAMGRWPFVRILIPLLALNSLAFLPYAHLLASWVRDELHRTMQFYPMLEGTVVVGALAGNLCWNRWHSKASLKQWIAMSISSSVFGMILFVGIPNVFTSVTGLFFIGMGTAIDGVAFAVFFQENVPNHFLGRAFGLVGTFSQIGGPFALLVFAVASNSHIVRPFFFVGPVTFSVSAWWILRWIGRPDLVQQLGELGGAQK